jgi:hypothetical protein
VLRFRYPSQITVRLLDRDKPEVSFVRPPTKKPRHEKGPELDADGNVAVNYFPDNGGICGGTWNRNLISLPHYGNAQSQGFDGEVCKLDMVPVL